MEVRSVANEAAVMALKKAMDLRRQQAAAVLETAPKPREAAPPPPAKPSPVGQRVDRRL